VIMVVFNVVVVYRHFSIIHY